MTYSPDWIEDEALTVCRFTSTVLQVHNSFVGRVLAYFLVCTFCVVFGVYSSTLCLTTSGNDTTLSNLCTFDMIHDSFHVLEMEALLYLILHVD